MNLLNFKSYIISIFIVFYVLVTGCAAPSSGTGPGRTLILNPEYKYHIGTITTEEKEQLEIDPTSLLRDALKASLKEKNLLIEGAIPKEHYIINARILDYDMGSAFKRWLMPGYGSTVLSIHTDIIEANSGEIITEMEHKQTIAAGGFYTLGAWESIFSTVANDITTDLERKYTGSAEGFTVKLDPWLQHETEIPKSKVSYTLYIKPLEDKRTEQYRIGERHAAFGVSMGDVYTNREVTAYINEAIQNELLASGNRISTDPKDTTISGEIIKFWVWTDTTALYWDINGEIELNLKVVNFATNKQIRKAYKAKSTSRTYIYPSETLVSEVVANTVRSLMYDIRKDSIWSKLD